MKELLLTGAAFAVLLAPAMAAENPVRVYKRPRPVVVAAPLYSWTGFYVGGNLGYSWGDARTDIAGSGTTISAPTIPLIAVTNPPATFADSQTQRLNGVIGGGQVGYNYQFGPAWVLGFEADIQASGERGSNTLVDPLLGTVCVLVAPQGNVCFPGNVAPLNAAAVTSYDAKIGWFGTVRGRLGVLIADQVLLYGTGGLAYGRVELSGVTNVNGSLNLTGTIVGPGLSPFTAPGSSPFSESRTKTGFAVGGGIEGKCSYWLPTGWTWKVEYLYVDLGSLDTVAPFPGANALGSPPLAVPFTTPFAGPLTTHTHFTDNIVRVGLNYKFGNYYTPVVTK
jgi:outer membrane immunogenic protein